ncbi:stage II sporulation protein M [Schaalia sp. lx-100]|uniref:stage II sporulation protein M n=1 Tax=Schaalia sp. lx-100 TaxID=2899081 RepID=UPI001E2D7269|nr:stage II sporulation protein M [Schaalia sp. lx-100]
MNIEALEVAHSTNWQRLHELSRRRRLDGKEIEELTALYQQGTADLAEVKTLMADPDITRRLSRDLAQARARLTGTTGGSIEAISRWFCLVLPAALYQIRWWIVGVTTVFLLVSSAHALWILWHPSYFAYLGSEEALKSYAQKSFVKYYSQDTSAEFGISVWFNNAFIALQCVGAGITGFYPIQVLFANAASIGTTAAIVIQFGGVWHFFRFILPHGLPELTAVFISGAAGLRIFWALIVPGSLTRMRAVAQAGRTMVTVAGGLVILLFISGMLEGFVTPSSLPDAVKITAGSLVVIALALYICVLGRRAYMAGYSGDIEKDAGYDYVTAG